MSLNLLIKEFSFPLVRSLRTSQGILENKEGWLIHLESSSGNSGWGEVGPIDNLERINCKEIISSLSKKPTREFLENGMKSWPRALTFGVGAALAELDGLVGNSSKRPWLKAPRSAILLTYQGERLIKEMALLAENHHKSNQIITIKLKFGIEYISKEIDLLASILETLPPNFRIRVDINGGWDRIQANLFTNIFFNEKRLEWIEQPLAAKDIEGLFELSKRSSIALDESLLLDPSLCKRWKDWQIRKPLLNGDPRLLLKELENGNSKCAISTAFETGIGLRWIHHLAALQQKGPTPTAPGLAPGWCLKEPLFSSDPEIVWESA